MKLFEIDADVTGAEVETTRVLEAEVQYPDLGILTPDRGEGESGKVTRCRVPALHMNVRPRAGVLKIAGIAGAKTANLVLADDVVHRKALLYSPPRPLIWVIP